jgi:ubiquinone/menaquinone biosynthesis C-methylase UbiE
LLRFLLVWLGAMPTGSGSARSERHVTSTRERYQRIAPLYDLLDLPFEYRRYRSLRPLLFAGMMGTILDAGVGTGRNFPFYPTGANVIGIDLSPAMLACAQQRLGQARAKVELREMDVTHLDFPDQHFDNAVATFLFCVLPDEQQTPALAEIKRVLKPGGIFRLLEYTRPTDPFRRTITKLWEPWVHWAYGASFDRNTEQSIPAAGLQLTDSQFVVADLIKLITARAV